MSCSVCLPSLQRGFVSEVREHKFITTISPTAYNQICLWGLYVQGGWKIRICVGRGGLSVILWYKKALGLRSGFVGQQQSRVGAGVHTGAEGGFAVFLIKSDWDLPKSLPVLPIILHTSILIYEYEYAWESNLQCSGLRYFFLFLYILMHNSIQHNSNRNRYIIQENFTWFVKIND